MLPKGALQCFTVHKAQDIYTPIPLLALGSLGNEQRLLLRPAFDRQVVTVSSPTSLETILDVSRVAGVTKEKTMRQNDFIMLEGHISKPVDALGVARLVGVHWCLSRAAFCPPLVLTVHIDERVLLAVLQ